MISGNNLFYHLEDLSKPILVSSTDPDKEYFVFCFKDKITCTKAKFKPISIQKSTEIILDSFSSVKVNNTQDFLMRDFTKKTFKDLKVNDSLAPLYLRKKLKYKQYHEISDYNKGGIAPSDKGEYRNVSRLAAEYILGRRLGENEKVKPKDKNQNNCNPTNLQINSSDNRHRQYNYIKALEEAQRVIKLLKNHKILEIKQEETDTLYSVMCEEKTPVAISEVFLISD